MLDKILEATRNTDQSDESYLEQCAALEIGIKNKINMMELVLTISA